MTTQPVRVASSAVEPVFPAAARRDTIGSSLVLKVWIQTDGHVETAEVMEHTETRKGVVLPADNPYAPLFAATAIEAVRMWRFTPAVQGGKPVDVWVTVPVRFWQTR